MGMNLSKLQGNKLTDGTARSSIMTQVTALASKTSEIRPAVIPPDVSRNIVQNNTHIQVHTQNIHIPTYTNTHTTHTQHTQM